MQRILSEPANYLRTLGQSVVRGWNSWFFSPADPTVLGLIRIILGAVAFWNLLLYGTDLYGFLGAKGWADPEIVQRVAGVTPESWSWSFWFSVPDAYLTAVWLGCLAILLCCTLGLFSRVTTVLAWVIVVSTVRRAPMFQFGYDQMITTLLFYLAATFSSGQALSLDRVWSRRRAARSWFATKRNSPAVGSSSWDADPLLRSGEPTPSIAANIGIRLIQMHWALIYGMAGVAKLKGDTWWMGWAVWPTWVDREFVSADWTWVADYPYVLNFATHVALVMEIAYPFLIWNWRLRPLILALVVVLHMGIGMSLALYEFAFVMLAGNLAFVWGPWLRSLAAGRVEDQPAARILYDGACPKCRNAMAWVTALDPQRVFEPVDLTKVDLFLIDPRLQRVDCIESMHLISRAGRIDVGYDAVKRILRWLPLAWPVAWITFLPGVRILGVRLYQRIAVSRNRETPCTDDVCGLPAGSASSSPKSKVGKTPPDENK